MLKTNYRRTRPVSVSNKTICIFIIGKIFVNTSIIKHLTEYDLFHSNRRLKTLLFIKHKKHCVIKFFFFQTRIQTNNLIAFQ